MGVFVAVGILGAQYYGSQPGLGLVRDRVRVLMKVVLLSEKMVVVVAVLVVVPIRPGESSNILSLSAVEVLHASQSVCAKDDAPENMSRMLVTLDTAHSTL